MHKNSKLFKKTSKEISKKKPTNSEGGYYEHLDNILNQDSNSSVRLKKSSYITNNMANEVNDKHDEVGRFKKTKVEENNNGAVFRTNRDSRNSNELDNEEINNETDNQCYFTVNGFDENKIHYSRHEPTKQTNKKSQEIDFKDINITSKQPLVKTSTSYSEGKAINDRKPKDTSLAKKSIAAVNSSEIGNEKPLNVKRRLITEVIGNIDKFPNDPSLNITTTGSQENIIHSTEDGSHNHSEHSSHHAFSGTGYSIIYGMFLFILGTFLSLDVYTGDLGDQRWVNTVFFSLLYGVSIFWLIFLYFDIKNYTIGLNEEFEDFLKIRTTAEKSTVSENSEYYIAKNVMSPLNLNSESSSHYLALNEFQSYVIHQKYNTIKKTKNRSSRQSSLLTIDENSNENRQIKNGVYYNAENDNNSVNNDDSYSELEDDTSNRFSGYLNDKSASYNLYLRAGIGAFCVVTLLQCMVDIIEAIENGFRCEIEMHEAIVAILQFIFACSQFLFIFLRGNIVICRHETLSSFFVMHITVTNLIVWVKNILLETMNEYFEEVLTEKLEHNHFSSNHSRLLSGRLSLENFNLKSDENISSTFIPTSTSTIIPTSTSPVNNTLASIIITAISNVTTIINSTTEGTSTTTTTNYQSENSLKLTECYTMDKQLQSFAITIKPYLYPATIEFSVICATVFAIMWTRIGSSENSHRSILTKTKYDEKVPYAPNPGMLIMLDCTKTSRGLFFGLLIFVCTILSTIIFHVYSSKHETLKIATIISQSTETALLLIALTLTIVAYFKITKFYTKVIPQMNVFDVFLEIFAMFGVYAFSINSLIAILYNLNHHESTESNPHLLLRADTTNTNSSNTNLDRYNNPLNIVSAVLSIIQSTIQTFFILECLRRYAVNKRELVNKPGRELITALLLTNISLWFYDTFSAKRFDTILSIVEHFGILKWSIINAFSSPIAIFYRFHSSVCLSDCWYGLYYGEIEKPENESIEEGTTSV